MKKKKLVWALLCALLMLCFHKQSVFAAVSVEDCIGQGEVSQSDACQDLLDTDEQQDNNAAASDTVSGTSTFMNFVKLGIALLVVLGLIYGLLKFLGKRNRLFQQVRSLENIGGISLGNNKSIQAVRIGEKVFLVGVGDSVELLMEVTDEKTINELQKQDNSEIKASKMLASLLPDFKIGKKEDKQPKKEQNSSFQGLFKHELEKMTSSRQEIAKEKQQKDEHQS